MNSKLPINLADLLRQRTVEGERIGYKAEWNQNAKVMKENGSPAPEFESDDGRTHLLIRLPVHTRAVEQAEVGAQSGVQSRAQSEQIMAALLKAPLSISEILNQLLFVWPTYLEQELKVDRAAAIVCQLRAEEDRLEKLEKQKHGLMHDLLTGKIAVNPRSEKQEALT